MNVPLVPVSWGEVIDKLTILEIKSVQIKDSNALANVETEAKALRAICNAKLPASDEVMQLQARLKAINEKLWNIEDKLREKERQGNFDSNFVELARLVYRTNDMRAAVKREINVLLGSQLIEEKSYAPY